MGRSRDGLRVGHPPPQQLGWKMLVLSCWKRCASWRWMEQRGAQKGGRMGPCQGVVAAELVKVTGRCEGERGGGKLGDWGAG
jgi:hypothetical protein